MAARGSGKKEGRGKRVGKAGREGGREEGNHSAHLVGGICLWWDPSSLLWCEFHPVDWVIRLEPNECLPRNCPLLVSKGVVDAGGPEHFLLERRIREYERRESQSTYFFLSFRCQTSQAGCACLSALVVESHIRTSPGKKHSFLNQDNWVTCVRCYCFLIKAHPLTQHLFSNIESLRTCLLL